MAGPLRIGIDLGGTKIEGVALDGDDCEAARRRIATPRENYDATIASVAGLVATLETAAGAPGTVGVGIPGTISPATGLVKNANSTWLNGRPFREDLERALGRPVRLMNDANCFAVAEAADGAAAGAATVFGVILGTGVGGGLVVAGEPVRGANAIAGEWGHTPLPWPAEDERPGRECWCGLSGCLETYLSGPGLAAEFAAATGVALDAAAIGEAAAAGESAAIAVLARYEERLARALAVVIDIFDPEGIVLGGGLSRIARLYSEVPQHWKRWVFSDHVATRLVPPRHGDAAGVRGAAWLWPRTGA